MAYRAGFFFDFDGTIVDNVSTMKDAYFAFMEKLNLKGSSKEFDSYNGVPLKEFLIDLNRREGLNLKVEILLNEYFEVLNRFYESTEPREGFLDILEILSSKGVPYCIVTSSTQNLLKNWIGKNLKDFEKIPSITSDDVQNGKPNPEPYIKAMELLSCNQGYAIEDSVNGLRSAIGAGLKGVFFANSYQNPVGLDIYKTITNFMELRDLIE